MIRSFRDKDSKAVHERVRTRKFPSDVITRAQSKLAQLDRAVDLDQLRIPPGNRLEALSGDRAGQYSIRINAQWRICFRWDGGAEDVEIVDYHG